MCIRDSLSWVLACERQQRRALERPFVCPKPAATPRYFGTPPGGSAGGGAKRKPRSMAPKAAVSYDVDLDFFSSSQALKDEAEGVPRGSSAKKRKKGQSGGGGGGSASAKKSTTPGTSSRSRRGAAGSLTGKKAPVSGAAALVVEETPDLPTAKRLRTSMSLPAPRSAKKTPRAGDSGGGLGGSGGKATIGETPIADAAAVAVAAVGAAAGADEDAHDPASSPIRALQLPHRTPGSPDAGAGEGRPVFMFIAENKNNGNDDSDNITEDDDGETMPPPPPVPIDLLAGARGGAVSYTHLTLPTILLV